MSKSKKTSKTSKTAKRSVSMKDLGAKSDPRGGRKVAVHYYKSPPPARHPVMMRGPIEV